MKNLRIFGVTKNSQHIWSQKWCQKTSHNESWPRPQGSASDCSGWLHNVLNEPQRWPGFSDRERSVGGAGATEATRKKYQGRKRQTRRMWCHRRQEHRGRQKDRAFCSRFPPKRLVGEDRRITGGSRNIETPKCSWPGDFQRYKVTDWGEGQWLFGKGCRHYPISWPRWWLHSLYHSSLNYTFTFTKFSEHAVFDDKQWEKRD